MVDATRGILSEPIQLSVRFEAELLEQIRNAARHSLRSTNAEINHRLRASFEQAAGSKAA